MLHYVSLAIITSLMQPIIHMDDSHIKPDSANCESNAG